MAIGARRGTRYFSRRYAYFPRVASDVPHCQFSRDDKTSLALEPFGPLNKHKAVGRSLVIAVAGSASYDRANRYNAQ